ncbi:MAG: hypothetical protein LDL41_12565 [Coleofasciculus sp. S288]|nr:hypothetical protein [Coleofasciculus sp. S288]
MSDEQRKPPESAENQPQTPPIPAAATPSETEFERFDETAKPIRNRKQPFFKAQLINVLRGTIGLLEGTVERLEAEPVRELPSTAVPPSRKSVSKPVWERKKAKPEPIVSEPTLETTAETPESIVSESALETTAETPESIVSESALETTSQTSESIVSEPILETTAEISEPITPAPPSDSPPVTPTSAAQKPAEMLEPQPTKPRLLDRILPSFRRFEGFWDATLVKIRALLPTALNEKLSDWALTGAIAGIVVVVLWTTVALLPETPAQEAKAPPNSIEAPPELKAPKPPEPVEVESPPAPQLTPEQSLIASIQAQVAEITERYGNGLIQSVEANFLQSRLIVKVSDSWYDLKESQQNNLADEMLRRSNELDFSKLEITDLNGTLVARSPVVGSNMVILKRQELATNL